MNRLRDYTRLVRMYGGALTPPEQSLTLPALEQYRDKIIEFLPGVDHTKNKSGSAVPVLTAPEQALVVLVLAPTSGSTKLVDDTAFETIYNMGTLKDGTGLIKEVGDALIYWTTVGTGYDASTLESRQDFVLLKLAEILALIASIKAAPFTPTITVPTVTGRVGKAKDLLQFEQAVIQWLINKPDKSAMPIQKDFNDHYTELDIQRIISLEPTFIPRDTTKVGQLLSELERCVDAGVTKGGVDEGKALAFAAEMQSLYGLI
jgi:hypothetical protein